MPSHKILDTFPAFERYWDRVRELPLEERVDLWRSDYMEPWPELLKKQLDEWVDRGMDWRIVAKEHVFPFVEERLPTFTEATDNLNTLLPDIMDRAQDRLGFDSDITAVIYVGLACGAGWVTRYAGVPAILFGLENIAACGWSDKETIMGLAAHELGHVAHMAWREQVLGEQDFDDDPPLRLLYSEGLAGRAEYHILGTNTRHESKSYNPPDWAEWCEAHLPWLAAEFRRRLDAGKPVKDFFGSWYDIEGYKQTGYYLAEHLVKRLENTMSFREIALLPWDEAERAMRDGLKDIAGD
jgi:hypothetical protein